jgi:hypothetical protein
MLAAPPPAPSYVGCDVAHQTALAHAAGAPADEVTRVAAQTATFQLLASIAAPFAAIHSAVALAQKALAHTRAARVGPSLVGLALIPALPLVDHPIEHGARRWLRRAAALAQRAGPRALTRSAVLRLLHSCRVILRQRVAAQRGGRGGGRAGGSTQGARGRAPKAGVSARSLRRARAACAGSAPPALGAGLRRAARARAPAVLIWSMHGARSAVLLRVPSVAWLRRVRR